MRYRRKVSYQKKLLLLAGKPPAKPWGKVSVRAVFHVWAKMDADNLQSRLKHALDALKAVRRIPMGDRHWRLTMGTGWFYDDNPSCLVGLEVEQVVDRKNQRLELTLSPVEP